MSRGPRPVSAPPTEPAEVPVSDLETAVTYYGEVLGFSLRERPAPTTAIVSGYGVRLRLRCTSRETLERARDAGPPEPVLSVPVAAPRRLRRRLDAVNADIVVPSSLRAARSGHFGVTDPDGNLLAFQPATGGLAPIRNQVGAILDSMCARLHERRRRRQENEHVESLRAFYENLPDKDAVFYLFFSEGMLHWALKALSYVPADVNVVLLGTALPDAERDWVRDHINRPFHHIGLRIDDRIAWEFLFRVNRRDFGWLDSDCLVLNPALFGEIARIAPRTSMNCVWAWESGYGWHLANTFFLFVSLDALSAVRRRGARPEPSSYDYDWHRLLVPGRRCYSRTPTRTQRRLLAEIVPVDIEGRPRTPHGMSYFDTMVMVQLLARSCGHPIRRIRELEGFGHLRGRPIQDESSDELVHIGGGSRADALSPSTGFFHDSQVRQLYLVAEHVMLDGTADRLPAYYARRHQQVLAALAAVGHTAASAEAALHRHLVHDRGLSPAAATAVLRSSTSGPAPTPTPDGS